MTVVAVEGSRVIAGKDMSTSHKPTSTSGLVSEPLQAYIDRILGTKRIDRGEEQELLRRYRDEGDVEAKHALIVAHMRFVVAIALGYRNYPVSMDDLISEASIGLVVALDKFDPSHGTRFVTYASFWIRAYVLDLVIRSWHSGHHGAGPFSSKVFFKLRRERARLYGRFGDGEAAIRSLARRMGMDEEGMRGMLQLLDSTEVSADQPLFRDQPLTLKEILPEPGDGPDERVEEALRQEALRACVEEALSTLDEREQLVIRDRMLSSTPRTLACLGERLGVSRERARQLEVRALGKLRGRLGAAWRDLCQP